jgi:prepilin-type N-terminal cleavage/methylation domain-containing protein
MPQILSQRSAVMFINLPKNEKGFTLTEVIIVAMIVAVLALVGIQLYHGYATEARRNTAETLAASAAAFLQTVLNNRDSVYFATVCTSPLAGPGEWVPELDSTKRSKITFKCPANSSVKIDGDSVIATVNGINSLGSYKFK